MEQGRELIVEPSMPGSAQPEWPDAVWIGLVDLAHSANVDRLVIEGGDRFDRCRLLVRSSGTTLGFVELPIVDGRVTAAEVDSAAGELLARPARSSAVPDVSVTVTVSTRNRGDQLATVLKSLLALDYPDLSFLIVDNASDDLTTEKVVAGLDDERFRCVREDRPGLSYGRNRALVEATTDVVAFTDDDVVVDPAWVRRLAEAFVGNHDIALVTGMVPTGELRTPAQQYFEQQTGWQRRCQPRTFRLADPPSDIDNFPLDVGHYGTGANFAVRRKLAIRLGGFNEALGIGSPTHGGEDLDMFIRVLYAGWALHYCPDAVVWHRHRADAESLERAVIGYSVSWSAWMTSLLENPDTRRDALRIGARHVQRRLRRGGGRSPATAPRSLDLAAHGFDHLPRVGMHALTKGPAAYRASRRSGRATRPLLGALPMTEDSR